MTGVHSMTDGPSGTSLDMLWVISSDIHCIGGLTPKVHQGYGPAQMIPTIPLMLSVIAASYGCMSLFLAAVRARIGPAGLRGLVHGYRQYTQ